MKKRPLGSEGHAMLELALVIPVMMLLCLSAVAIAGGISDRQTAAVLARELASSAFRTCAVDYQGAQYESVRRGVTPSECLAAVEASFGGTFANAIPAGSGFGVTMYGMQAPGTPVQLGTAGSASTFSVSDFQGASANQELKSSLERLGVVVVAECRVPYAYRGFLPINISYTPAWIHGIAIM